MRRCTKIFTPRVFAQLVALIVIAAAIGGGDARAQSIEVPFDIQCRLFGQILQFDMTLRDRVGDTLVMAIVFQGDYRVSERAKEECQEGLDEIAKKPIQGLPGRVETIDLNINDRLDSQLVARQADVIVVMPLRPYAIDHVVTASRKLKRLTLSTVAGYVEGGLSVGIGLKDNKPEIVVNLSASRLEGAELSAKLLRLCRIVGQIQPPY